MIASMLTSCTQQFWLSLRWVRLLMVMTLLWGGLTLPSYAVTVQDIANPRASGGWVTDQAQVISADGERQLNQLLTRLDAKTQVEMAVVTVAESLHPEPPRTFGKTLFNTWGIGKAEVNNGVLLLVAVGDRRIEILTGTGMGTRLPDSYVHDLIQSQIKPAFQQGNLEAGIVRGVNHIAAKLIGSDLDRPVADWVVLLIIGIGTVGCGLTAVGYGWINWLRHQPIHLPPTGHHHEPYGFLIADLCFDRLVALTAHRVGWPRSPFILLTLGLSLFSGALAAIALLLLDQTHFADQLYARFGVIGLSSILSLALLYPIDCWLKRSAITLQPMIGGSLTSLILVVGLCLPGFGLVLALQQITWETATIADLLWTAPLYVGVWNAAIAGWFAKENIGFRRVPPQYHCQTCNQAIVEATQARDRLVFLFPKLSSTAYRGWRCPTCHPTVTAEGVFLITQEPRHYTTASSGYGNSTTYTSYDSTASDSSTTWDSSSSSSSSDFGGGYTDGGGSGDSW